MTRYDMGSGSKPMPDQPSDGDHDDSLRSVYLRLYEDGRAYAEAELNKQKLRAGIVATAVRNAAIFAIVALIIVFAAIVTLLVGLVIALTPSIGAVLATLIVVGVSIAIVIALLLLAKSCISRMKEALKP